MQYFFTNCYHVTNIVIVVVLGKFFFVDAAATIFGHGSKGQDPFREFTSVGLARRNQATN
jgi:hypothetical protein